MITKQTLLDFMGRKRPIFYNDEALSKAVEISNDCAAEKSVTLKADVKTVSAFILTVIFSKAPNFPIILKVARVPFCFAPLSATDLTEP